MERKKGVGWGGWLGSLSSAVYSSFTYTRELRGMSVKVCFVG